MNASFVETFGRLAPPVVDTFSRPFANSFAVSQKGAIAVICLDGKFKYSNIRNVEDNELINLDVYGLSNEDALEYSSIEFNNDGTILLLWAENSVGLIELPQSLLLESNSHAGDNREVRCTFTKIYDEELSSDSSAPFPVVKVGFHPYSQNHVIILFQRESLRVVDLRSLATEIIFIAADRKFTSYTFGPAIEWLRFTVFLLSSSGEVFSLCPLIPTGSIVSLAVVAELWDWADQLLCENETPSSSISALSSSVREGDAFASTLSGYNALLKVYLSACFGTRPGSQDPAQLQSSFIRVGERDQQLSEHAAQLLCNYSPVVRGPLGCVRPAGTRHTPTANSASSPFSESKSPSRSSSSASRSGGGGVAANDICCLGGVPDIGGSFRRPTTNGAHSSEVYMGSQSAPLLAISYANGDVELVLLDAEAGGAGNMTQAVVRTSSYLGPSWRNIDISRPLLTCSSLSMLVAEVVSLSNMGSSASSSAPSFWSIRADQGTCNVALIPPFSCRKVVTCCTMLVLINVSTENTRMQTYFLA
jgi:hypothetical protein